VISIKLHLNSYTPSYRTQNLTPLELFIYLMHISTISRLSLQKDLTHIHTYIYINSHTVAYIHIMYTHSHAYMHINGNPHIHKRAHTCTQILIHTCIQHTYIHTPCMHTNSHTHTCCRWCPSRKTAWGRGPRTCGKFPRP